MLKIFYFKICETERMRERKKKEKRERKREKEKMREINKEKEKEGKKEKEKRKEKRKRKSQNLNSKIVVSSNNSIFDVCKFTLLFFFFTFFHILTSLFFSTKIKIFSSHLLTLLGLCQYFGLNQQNVLLFFVFVGKNYLFLHFNNL
jgi:uncharacterized membrane protein